MNNLQAFTKTLKVLYVEDNEEARIATLGFLSNLFEDITVAIDGTDGLEKFQNNTYDLIVSDINMPRMNGIEMTREIRKKDQQVPILILSAYNESGYFIETIKHGVDGYLLKPIDLKQFLEIIHKVAEKIYLKKELHDYQTNLEQKVKLQNEKLYNLFYYDKLTTLPNKNSLEKTIEELHPHAIMLIDVKDFSAINDIYGSEIGDRILVSIAKNLVAISNDKYRVFRVNADTFALLDMKDDHLNFTPQTVEKIVNLLENSPINTEDNDDTIALNISTTVSIASNYDFTKLLKNAELALHYAKNKAKHIVYYSDELNISDQYKKELQAVHMVKKALQEDRVVPFFQEIIKDEKQKTFECLVRIIDNNKVITPFFFLNAIKKTSYYSMLTRVVINKAFEHFKDTNFNFSINLSYEDIADSETISFIEEKLQNSNMAKQLILEILESESIENFQLVKNFIQRMHKYGVRIAIDDFGSGYSNFSHILELSPDFIKIDGSLVKDVHENHKSFIIVKTINNFAKELGIKTIVEYVHNEAVYNKVKELDISGYQGYYFSEPKKSL